MRPVHRKFTIAALVMACCVLSSPAQTPTAPAHSTQPAAKAYFVRIIPPRSTFAQDITDPEKKLMDDHYAYWTVKYNEGVCLLGGPVLDPKGVYGILVIRAATEDDARAIASADPSVKGGLTRTEVSEMILSFPPAAHESPHTQ
jgi:uncharacterized protein YciI